MKKMLKYIAAAMLSVSLFTGCIKEVVPTSGLLDTQVTLESQVAGIPVQMIYPGFAGIGYHCDFGYPSIMMVLEMYGEDFYCVGNYNYDHFLYYYFNMMQGPMYSWCTIFWNCYWPWVKSCNDVIRRVQNEGGNPVYEGIARLYRAFYYLDLVRLYEFKPYAGAEFDPEILGLSVPLVTEKTTELEASNNPRATVEAVYELIFSDLAAAEELLADYARIDKTHPNLAVVYGLYARAYLERTVADPDTYYPLAAEYARKAINASGCSIMSQTQWEDPSSGFNDASNSSWMWALMQQSENVSNLMSWTGWMSCEQSWGYANFDGMVAYGISKALYDQIPDNDFRKHSWIDSDPRFYDYKVAYTDRDYFLEHCPALASIKFRPAGGNCTDYKTGNATDIPLMRVEEMYLIEAEAAGYTNLAQGKSLLSDFMAHRITDGTYTTYGIYDFESLLKEVIKQKRIEFWGEGRLFFDYKRLELGYDSAYSGTNCPSYAQKLAEGVAPWWNVCIPLSEEQNNRGVQGMNNPDPSY